MAKIFPVQNVSFRGVTDNFLTEAGGSDKLPNWVSPDIILTNAARVHQQLGQIADSFSNRDSNLPILTEVSLNEKATAKSHRPAARKLLDVKSKRNVLGVTSTGKLLVKIDSTEDLRKIESGFSVTSPDTLAKDKKKGLATIESISRYKAIVDNGISSDDCLKLQMVDYLNNEYNHRSLIALVAKCQEFGVSLEELNYASSLRLFCLKNVSGKALDSIASMDCVLAVRKMPTIEFEVAPNEDDSHIEMMSPQVGVDYPLVGLLDSGVSSNNAYLHPWMLSEDDNVADLLDSDINRSHGTAVASVINYGDFLENRDLTQCGPCKIQSCIVNSDRITIFENELVTNIQNAISKHPDIKIWNLSQGTNKVIEDDRYSDLGVALDSLQKDNKILICKSAGNVDPQNPIQRITSGADSLLSLVVGSIAHKKTAKNDADVNDRSPFSRIGPGVENAVKPDLVHYGGNADTHLSLFSEWGRQFCRWSGTSFSTPRVTALAANLCHEIGGTCDPLLLKAILVHNSSYPTGLVKTAEEFRREMGFGLPSGITDMLSNNADECTMVFRHTLERGVNIVSLDFPYPQCLVDDGFFVGEITLTMAVNPIINASQGCEYCQSQVDVLLETYDHIEYVDLKEDSMMRNEARMSNDAVNVLNASLYSKKAFKNKFSEERMLIEQGDKYQPIKKYAVDLSKMTNTNKAKALGCNRKWALKLNGLYRDAAEQSLLRDGEFLSQDVVVIVTIKDPDNRRPVYSECIDLLQQRGYVHNDICVHNNINVETR